MKLKLLLICLLLAVLLIPTESKPKHKEKHGHGGRGGREKKKQTFDDIIEDIFFGDTTEDDEEDDQSFLDWLVELQDLDGQCTPNPCLNNGVCEKKGRRGYKCDCPKPFKGRTCARGPKVCMRGVCGRGECVLTSTPPYYECKCKYPFQPPDCKRYSVCQPNPCRNGGQCIQEGNDFDCQCTAGFRGRFCHVGPDDCYVNNGESYRGNVSETDDGFDCLYWNSHLILENGAVAFNSFENNGGLGPHHFCRNPDGEPRPWCFFRRGRRLLWDYCDVTQCPKPTGDPQPPTVKPQPPTVKPQPPTVKPQPPTVKPQPTTVKPQPPTAKPQPPTVKPQPPTVKPQPTTVKPQPTTVKPTPATTQASETTKAPQPSQETTAPPPSAAPKQFETCGVAQPKRTLTRIFGGLKVSPGAIPWQVSLQQKPKNSSVKYNHVCGGVLIESCWVLTAGHCIEPNKDMQVVMGTLALDKPDSAAQIIKVENAIVHENYRETSAAVYNDIALLRLRGADGFCANETQFVKTACLPSTPLADGTECTISGWGATEESHYGTNHLLEAKVLLIGQEKCSESSIYGSVLDNTMFCAGYLQGGVDSCQGDSGGPLTCKQNNTSVVYGLISWGDQCGKKNKPGVYARVNIFLNWIKSKTQASP